MENEKECKNCRYAKQHYMINADMRFVKLHDEMHCSHGKVTKTQFRIYFRGKDVCDYWEPCELQRREKIYRIKELLQSMDARLNHALQIMDDMTIDE